MRVKRSPAATFHSSQCGARYREMCAAPTLERAVVDGADDVRRADALPPVALLHPAADRGRRAAVCGRGGVASSAAARRAAAAVGAVRARALRRAQLLFDLRLRRRHRVAVRGEVDEHAASLPVGAV